MDNEFMEHVENTRRFLKSSATIHVGIMAMLLKQSGINTGEKRFYKLLRENNYVHNIKSKWNLPTQKSIDLGIMKIKKRIPVITTKGQFFFWMLLRKNDMNNILNNEKSVISYLIETESPRECG